MWLSFGILNCYSSRLSWRKNNKLWMLYWNDYCIKKKNYLNMTEWGLMQVQQEIQFITWSWQCCHIDHIVQSWFIVISTLVSKTIGIQNTWRASVSVMWYDEEVKCIVEMVSKTKGFFMNGFQKLLQFWGKCIKLGVDYKKKIIMTPLQ